jgi:ATP-dependent DNA helicase PIF1
MGTLILCIICVAVGYFWGAKSKNQKSNIKFNVNSLEPNINYYENDKENEGYKKDMFRFDDMESTPEIVDALKKMEQTKDSVYITGKAGTGKSTLLKHFCKNTQKNIVILAPTGVAALNVGGVTLNSFFQFPFGVIEHRDVKYLFKKQEIFKKLDSIIIDEISMVRADMMDAIDYSLRANTGNKDKPFGGIQVIMFGDLYQLPPVAIGEEKSCIDNRYGGVYFFYGIKGVVFDKIYLTKIFRQEGDDNFKDILNKIREDNLCEEDLKEINTRVTGYDALNGPAITLATTNNIADNINLSKLSEIKSSGYLYRAEIQGSFKENEYPADKELKLKKGAQVMFIKNDSGALRRWANGTLGLVEKCEDGYIIVNVNNKKYKVERVKWEVFDYKYDHEKDKIEKYTKGSFSQYPLKLAWSFTIHKSQGKTYDKVIIDFGNGAFAHGQAYVAFSRCTKFDNLYLKTPLKFSDVILDDTVVSFHEK